MAIRDTFREFGRKSSLHVVGWIVFSRQFVFKVVWALLLLASSGCLAYLMMELFKEYFAYSVKYTIKTSTSSLFLSDVTICNMNAVKSSKVALHAELQKKLKMNSSDDMWAIFDEFYDETKVIDPTPPSNILTVRDEYEIWKSDVLSTYMQLSATDKNDVGHQFTDLFHHVRFAGYKIETDLSGSLFKRTLSNAYGNCYTLSGNMLEVKSRGPRHGLTLTLNIEKDEYIEHFATSYAVRLVIHEHGSMPLPYLEGITLQPGHEVDIALENNAYNRLDGIQGSCTDGLWFRNTLNAEYTVQACYAYCETEQVRLRCGCRHHDSLAAFDRGEPPCNSSAEMIQTCITTVLEDINKYIVDCNCKPKCREHVYSTRVSSRKWPNKNYFQKVLLKESCARNMTSLAAACQRLKTSTYMQDPYLYEQDAENFLRLNIYYKDLTHRTNTVEPLYSMVTFISNIGGLVAVCIGASVLTVMEIVQLILELILCLGEKKRPSDFIKKSITPLQVIRSFPKQKRKLSAVRRVYVTTQ